MTRNSLYFLFATLCATSLFAQPGSDSQSDRAGKLPAAYVYVSSSTGGSANQVEGFSAYRDGTLTPVPGSPFNADLTSLAVNGRFLFGSNTSGLTVDSYRVKTDGRLEFSQSTNIEAGSSNDCASSGPLFTDRTGSSLYDLEYRGDSCANNAYTSFGVNHGNGSLKDLGNGAVGSWLANPASFLGTDVYAYSASCLGDMFWSFFGLTRQPNGLLKQISVNAAPPAAKPGDFYCPSQAAAGLVNHVAFTMQAVDGSSFSPDGLPQLASYTVDLRGNLTTTNTRATMPTTAVVNVTDLKMSPWANLLAVSGTGGVQVFHFNAGNPITAFTPLLTHVEIDQVFWDNANHLYAISRPAGKLFVFTVTASGYQQAPGSPYTVKNAQYLAVQPRTLF